MSAASSPAYGALALQHRCHAVNGCGDVASARARIAANLDRVDAQLRASLAFLGPAIRLVVLPEYFATGFPTTESAAAWIAKACFAPEGAEYERLARIAADRGVHLAGNAYETDQAFPGLFFQTSFIVSPAGAVVLRYRRLNSMFAATPHDVWDAYLDRYGLDGVFPVARTELGNLAAVASEEILYPEIARCMVLRGAEVLVHSTSQIHGPMATGKDIARRARALENLAYLVSANSAGITDAGFPEASTDGGSQIVDHRGIVLAHAGAGETMSAHAEIDLAALRRARRQPGMSNLLSRQRLEAVAPVYAATSIYPPNTLRDGEPSRERARAAQRQAIARLDIPEE